MPKKEIKRKFSLLVAYGFIKKVVHRGEEIEVNR